MKKVYLFLALLLTLSVFFSCNDTSKTHSEEPIRESEETHPPHREEVTFDVLGARYIRTNGYNENFEYPRLIEINSCTELEAYYNYFNGIYSLGHVEKVYSDTTVGFADVMTEYNDEYFLMNKLYLAVLEEGSGSIRHEVGELKGTDLEIKSVSPECCTDDMAEWHIFIEVNRGAEINSINSKNVPVYTPDGIYSEFMMLLDKTARDYLKERYFISEASLTWKDRTDFGVVKDTGFYNPLGYSPGYDASPVWVVEGAAIDIGSFTLYLCDAPFVFGSHGLDKWETVENTFEEEAVRETFPSLNLATLTDLIDRYGEDASWDTFAPYWHIEIGSGLYILRYPIDLEYSFVIGGTSPVLPPLYMRLVSEYDGRYIDVREEDIEKFISDTKVISEFNYRDDAVLYKKENAGVKTDGFVNTERVAVETIRDAVKLAENECSVEYDTVKIWYDYTKRIWKINFSRSNTLGGDQSVYLDRDGITLMRVSGE